MAQLLGLLPGIRAKIIVDEARRRGIQVSDEEIEVYLDLAYLLQRGGEREPR